MPVKDLIGIGIGPFNLSLAAMAKDTGKLDAAFFDANPEFSWHPGMLLPTATMQTYVLQDLVTTVAPRSEFSSSIIWWNRRKFTAFWRRNS